MNPADVGVLLAALHLLSTMEEQGTPTSAGFMIS